MARTIEYTTSALRQLKKIDREISRRITRHMDDRVAVLDDPRKIGKALAGPFKGLWRYRVGDYRVICEIQDRRVVVLVLSLGHRSAIYHS